MEPESESPKTTPKVPATPKPEPIDVEKAREVIFQPNEGPQTDFLSAEEQEVLYGGAAGGGKSYAMLADPVRNFNNPRFRGLLLRRTNDELRELISVSKLLYPKAIGAKWLEREKTWVLPAGGQFWMTYLDKEDDVMRYQGQAFNWIGFDELTQWPSPHAWNYLRSRLRSASGLPLYQRATSNPGGPGHAWVKKTFVDPAPWGEAFPARDFETGEVLTWPKGHSKEGEPLFQRRFIPAKLFDNPYLTQDGHYEANLLSLPEHERRKLLEGDWDVNEGAAFPEWNRAIHVVEPFEIDHNWVRFRACDYGYGSYSAVVWFAIHPSGQLIVYRELYVKGLVAEDLAEKIAEIEHKAGERLRYAVLDSSVWHQRGQDYGPSMAEKMNNKLREMGCRVFRKADRSKGSRVSGKNEIHKRLMMNEFTGQPDLVVFNTCTNGIAQMASIPLDTKNPEDVDTHAEDHWYDALRYGCMTRPINQLNPSRSPDPHQVVDTTFGY